MDADEAQRIGLVDQLVPDADAYDAATKLLGQFLAGPTQALRRTAPEPDRPVNDSIPSQPPLPSGDATTA